MWNAEKSYTYDVMKEFLQDHKLSELLELMYQIVEDQVKELEGKND